MLDVDILVPYTAFDAALDVLEGDGFATSLDIPRDRRRRNYHGAGMAHPDGRLLDVHWQLALPFVLPHAEAESGDDFWNASEPLDLGELSVRTLCPADMLLHVIVHGLWSGSAANVRWVADSTRDLGAAQHTIDWDRVLDQTVRRDLVVPVSNGLRYLDDVLAAPGPPQRDRRTRPVAREPSHPARPTPHHARDQRAGDPRRPARDSRAYWVRQSSKWGPVRCARELPYFMQENWDLDRPARCRWRPCARRSGGRDGSSPSATEPVQGPVALSRRHGRGSRLRPCARESGRRAPATNSPRSRGRDGPTPPRQLRAAAHLPQAGQARLHEQPSAHVGAVVLDLGRQRWPGPTIDI